MLNLSLRREGKKYIYASHIKLYLEKLLYKNVFYMYEIKYTNVKHTNKNFDAYLTL